MKRLLLIAGVAFVIIMLNAFRTRVNGSIKGKIMPVGAARSVIAINGKDSVKANIISADFSISVNPGNYKLVVEAESPYKSAVIENIEITEGATKDVGEILLKQ